VDKDLVRQGDPILVTIDPVGANVAGFGQIQVDIATCGRRNNVIVVSSGVAPEYDEEGIVHVSIPTESLSGFFEVYSVKFHSDPRNPTAQSLFKRLDDFERIFFHAYNERPLLKDEASIRKYLADTEEQLEREFLSGIDISASSTEKRRYVVLCFLRGVLIKRRFRLDRYELIPYHGIDRLDVVSFVNEFLSDRTQLPCRFEYNDDLRTRVRNENPALILHYPLIIARNEENAIKYALTQAQLISESLAYMRGGVCEAFATLAFDRDQATAQIAFRAKPYRGNLLSGMLSGEDPETFEFLSKLLIDEPQIRYFVSLYTEASRELDPAFEYLRYWAILEAIAESKNFDRHEEIKDCNNEPIFDRSGKSFKCSGSRQKVYKLLHKINHQISNPFDERDEITGLWVAVDSWFAMRNASAHFGRFDRSSELQKNSLKSYELCDRIVELQQGELYGPFLLSLKTAAKLALAKEIFGNGH